MLKLAEIFVQGTLAIADTDLIEIGGRNSEAYIPFGYFSWYLYKRIHSVGFLFTPDVYLTGFVPKGRSLKIMRRKIEKNQERKFEQKKIILIHFLFF